MYSIRLLDQNKTLLGVLPVITWSYDRKISKATSINVTIPRTSEDATISESDLFAFLSPFQIIIDEESTAITKLGMSPTLAYYLQLYRDTTAIGMGIIAKRDYNDTTISIKAHTEEHLLSLRKTPAKYGGIYDNTDICDLARSLLKGWRSIRVKQNWDTKFDSSQIDYTTEPNVVILDKDGSGIYYDTGYITFEFEQPDDFDSWERIRWSADNEAPVFTTMAYRTWNGAAWSAWSSEYEGALPEQIGIEITDTDAVKVQVRITLSTDDQESEDDAGDPVGSTPALFAVEIIARTPAYLTGSIPASSTAEVVGLTADGKTPLQLLRDACDQVGWEFQVFYGVLYVAEKIGEELQVLFRAGTNMDITQLGDDAGEIVNYLIANGTGDGINRPQVTVKNSVSIASYGVRQAVKNFEIEDYDDLETAAEAYLATLAEPTFNWKVKTKFPYDESPDFGAGDTVTVVDPKSSVVVRSRIMEQRLAYSNDKLTTECYLGKTRADLVPKTASIYKTSSLSAPKTLAISALEKGLVIVVQKPENSSLWAYTELYLKTSSGVTISADSLVGKKRATLFNKQGLLPKKRYYAKARYVDIYGRATDPTPEISMETLKFSTPFEDMQPADSDPGTLAFQTNGGKVKIYNDGTVEGVNSKFTNTYVNGRKIEYVYGTGDGTSADISITLATGIAYTASVILNLFLYVEGLTAAASDNQYPIGGKLESTNLDIEIGINQYLAAVPTALGFKTTLGKVILVDNGTTYDLKFISEGASTAGSHRLTTPYTNLCYDDSGSPSLTLKSIKEVLISGTILIE